MTERWLSPFWQPRVVRGPPFSVTPARLYFFFCEFLLDFEVKWYVRLPVFLVGPVLLSALFRYGYLHPYGGDWVDVIRPAEDDTGRSGS